MSARTPSFTSCQKSARERKARVAKQWRQPNRRSRTYVTSCPLLLNLRKLRSGFRPCQRGLSAIADELGSGRAEAEVLSEILLTARGAAKAYKQIKINSCRENCVWLASKKSHKRGGDPCFPKIRARPPPDPRNLLGRAEPVEPLHQRMSASLP